ncbi:hypothetical protein [Paenibacillus crassostreae]|uniref:Uncharacterized protein n=1 Tax=Paenibacillus crassostreae TaxID=1763538 RepID=A0A167C566_9BACL|nr:hypothetical protein [Paenibacillus crassostreae]AOZ91632.1 hypothetical protein LPB68_04970 [Paenibacillus crassostreae]OAB72794.1 hypothetical protein PNBC_15280 [Paenibacillus crassostreae]
MNFKEQAALDVTQAFFNVDEFSEEVEIDGVTKPVMIDDDQLKKRSDKEYFGITTGMLLYFIPVAAYGDQKPKVGNSQIFGKKQYWIDDVKGEDTGVFEIMLTQNRGE